MGGTLSLPYANDAERIVLFSRRIIPGLASVNPIHRLDPKDRNRRNLSTGAEPYRPGEQLAEIALPQHLSQVLIFVGSLS
ncbi:hypothetical protein DTO212C5_8033 [Paecilomyces variotii]|nr:hypothetical protein DTO212C5_8033 [Paecilomyces variotii]